MDKKILAIIAVAIVVVAGAAAAVAMSNNSNEKNDDKITIVDGSNNTITFDQPLTKIAVTGKNIALGMAMLGVGDKAAMFHYATSSNVILPVERDSSLDVGSYYTPSVETMLAHGVQAVICPVASMTLYSSAQKACEEVGIKVVRLDCNGDSLYSDLQTLSKMFGNPQSAKTVLEEYNSNQAAAISAVAKALSDYSVVKKNYISGVLAMKSVYTVNSAFHNLYGKNLFTLNCTSLTDLPATSTQNKTETEGTIEALRTIEKDIDNIIIRGGNNENTADNYKSVFQTYVGDSKAFTSSAKAVADGRFFVVNASVSSGLPAYLGLIMMAEIVYGIDVTVTFNYSGVEKTYTGLEDLNTMFTDFCKQYSQNSLLSDGNLLMAQFDKDGNISESWAYSKA